MHVRIAPKRVGFFGRYMPAAAKLLWAPSAFMQHAVAQKPYTKRSSHQSRLSQSEREHAHLISVGAPRIIHKHTIARSICFARSVYVYVERFTISRSCRTGPTYNIHCIAVFVVWLLCLLLALVWFMCFFLFTNCIYVGSMTMSMLASACARRVNTLLGQHIASFRYRRYIRWGSEGELLHARTFTAAGRTHLSD